MRRKLKKSVCVIFAFMTIMLVLSMILSNAFSAYKMKYVLIWTHPRAEPFLPIGPGSEIFTKRNCPVQNCYVTSDVKLLNNISKFDAILFHGPEIVNRKPQNYFPKERYPHQSYIFTSMESSHIYQVPDTRYHGVFNFTWTYKLNSDISFKYMVIRDREGKIIGPNATIDWMRIEDMLPINESLKTKLASKSIAATWVVSNCRTHSGREILASKIVKELRKYNMILDIYGACVSKYFPQKYINIYLRMLRRDYYFYFAFENSLSDDYVTEKLRNALQNYAVPIVYGAADYKRFMPDGIYLNAGKMTVENLVKQMVEIIKNKTRYYEFFKWHNHYSYHHPEETPDTDPYCSLCSFINNINQSKVSTIENFYKWWNPIEIIQKLSKSRH